MARFQPNEVKSASNPYGFTSASRITKNSLPEDNSNFKNDLRYDKNLNVTVDNSGKILGKGDLTGVRYEKTLNVTLDAKGNIIGKGNLLRNEEVKKDIFAFYSKQNVSNVKQKIEQQKEPSFSVLSEKPKNEFVESSKEFGQKLIKGDLVGSGFSFGRAFFSGIGQAGELISGSAESLKSQIPRYNKNDVSKRPVYALSEWARLGFSGVSGFGSTISSSAYLVRDTPQLISGVKGFLDGGIRNKPVIQNLLKSPIKETQKSFFIGVGAVTGFLGEQGKQFSEDPVKYSGEFVGGNVAFGVIGKTANLVPKGSILIGSVGKTFVPAEKLVAQDVLSGAARFPTAKGVKEAIYQYEKTNFKTALGKPAVYSASDYPFTPFIERNIELKAGRGLEKTVDVPGLYTSTKGVSTYFLRLNEQGGKYSLFPKQILSSSPKIFALYEAPKRIPASFRTSLSKAQTFFGKSGLTQFEPKGIPGKPYYSPALEFGFKNEAEAVVQVGTKLKRIGLASNWEKLSGFSKFTKIKGEIVPIYELGVVGKAKVKTFSVSANDYAASSSGIKYKPILSYSRIGVIGSKLFSKSSKLLESSGFNNYSSSIVNYFKKFNYSSKKSFKRVSSFSVSKQVKSYLTSGFSSSFTSSGKSSKKYLSSLIKQNKSYAMPKNYSNYYFSNKKTKYKQKEPFYFKPSKKFFGSNKKLKKVYFDLGTNNANVILPIKTNWLKQLKYFEPKTKIKEIKLLPNILKGNKDIASLVRF